jgi:outer membrane protein TolC
LRLSGETPANKLHEYGISVAQPIELGNRKALRMEVAERIVSVSEARLTEVLRRQLFDVKRTYYDSVLARVLLDIEQENRDNFEGLVKFNTVRFEEGYIAQGDLIKVRLERTKFDFAVASAELALRRGKIRLLELIGERDFERAVRVQISNRLQVPAVDLNLMQLKETALVNRPEIKVAEAELALAQSSIKLERSSEGRSYSVFRLQASWCGQYGTCRGHGAVARGKSQPIWHRAGRSRTKGIRDKSKSRPQQNAGGRGSGIPRLRNRARTGQSI